ncbi:MAG TPA: proline--tRNA ligase, partial [Thermodesulfobacteriota bacterium]|nr:proline--tRNA ligase [Thermodesulfobacteriota bacterium]
ITDLVRREVHSYRQLPLNLYQIQTKFRDEIRPRFGLIRAREFIMKDGYSFDLNETTADQTYQAMYNAYARIFSRCGLRFKSVEADSGPIGGSFSHEFMVLAETGEDTVISCTACAYAANLEKAEIPAPLATVTESSATLAKVHTPNVRTVAEVAGFFSIPLEKVLKTLLYETDEGVVAVLLRGDHELNEVKLKNFLKVNELALAAEDTVRRETGATVGFAGPLHLKIPVYADLSLQAAANLVAGANENDFHYTNINFMRDIGIKEFIDLRQVTPADPCPRCGASLDFLRGIEVGHVFKLGYKYSKAMNATYLDAQGQEQLMYMGCYGIGVSRIIAAAIEQNNDSDGIIFPMPLAPFQILLVPIAINDTKTMDVATRLYEDLTAAGLEVLFDDRDERPGVKFKDADLLGIPYRVVLGPKTLAKETAEVRSRRTREMELISLQSLLDELRDRVRAEMAL